jgi:hypothetical protein
MSGLKITSVYLKGSFAYGTPCYGLSDIDLFLVTEKHQKSVATAIIIEKLRKQIRFRIIGEIELLTTSEIEQYTLFEQKLYPQLYYWKHYRGSKFNFLNQQKIHLASKHYVGFACFQYVFFKNLFRYSNPLLSNLKEKRLFQKIINIMGETAFPNEKNKELEEKILRLFNDQYKILVTEYSSSPVPLVLNGLFPFTVDGLETIYVLKEVANDIAGINQSDKILCVDVIVNQRARDLIYLLMNKDNNDIIQKQIYREMLIFQKFGAIINLFGQNLLSGHPVRILQNIQCELKWVLKTGPQDQDSPENKITNQSIYFCESAIASLKKLT